MQVRTRFAPSPTGLLHVGNARAALYAWLYAKHFGGTFVLRIEDTDRERSTQEAVDVILEGMQWMGLNWDEGPYYQTDRTQRYQHWADYLLQKGQAYRCTCSKERLTALRDDQLARHEKPKYDGFCRDKQHGADVPSHVIRFKNPSDGVVTFDDEVYGSVSVENHELDDLIIVRSDGQPTYNFAVVVDDWEMGITHVIRGDDHINNTPRQINLYRALQAPVPVFAHLPMILGDDGKRLSKRHGAVSVLEFRSLGFLPHALLNYLVRLGWSHGDQEIFSREAMIEAFDLHHVSRGVSSFNYDKLHWLNQHYLKNDPPEQVADDLSWHFVNQGMDKTHGPDLIELVKVQGARCKTLVELCEISRCFYTDELIYDEDAVKKHLRPVVLEPLEALLMLFKSLNSWNRTEIQATIEQICTQFDMKMAKIAQPLRVATTGQSSSPAIDDTLMLVGQQRTILRLEGALVRVRQRQGDAR